MGAWSIVEIICSDLKSGLCVLRALCGKKVGDLLNAK